MSKKGGGEKNELKVLENDEKMPLEVGVKNGQATQNLSSMTTPQYKRITEVPRGFQAVRVPRLRDNSPGWW